MIPTPSTIAALSLVLFSAASSAVLDPPAVGSKAPDFTLAALDDSRVTLSKELARGPVVLIVGRGWVGYQCPFCNRQFNDFSKRAPEIAAAGARVIWIYPGPTDQIHQRAKEFLADRPMPANFSVVLDPDYTLTQAYSLRWDAPAETAYPATFVIDRAGIVRYALVSRTHGGRAAAADVLGALKGLK
jgi:peroxiredoxin